MPAPIHFQRGDAANLVDFAKMDLGQSSSSYIGCASPAGPPKKYYPTLYVNGVKEIDLPLTGKATIEYRLRSKTKRQDEDGKLSESADIEVLSIDPVVADTKAKPKADGAATVIKKDFSMPARPIQFASPADRAKALANGTRRPLATSKLNPYAMRRTPHDETRISPRLSKIAETYKGGHALNKQLVENKANYVPGAKAEGRQAAAGMLRRFRETKILSRADAADMVEFARG